MDVICELMKLKRGRVKEYLELHNDTWPELIQAIRESGFIEEYIYIIDNLVVVIMKCNNFENSRKSLLEKPVFQRWTGMVQSMLMEDRKFFKTDEKIIDLRPVWNLSEY